jgi:hypothetical protein
MTVSAEMVQAADSMATVQVIDANAPTIASTVLTPTHESALATTDPVSVTGGAYALNYLKSLTLTVNSNVIFTTAWPSNTVTDTLWSTIWTPAAEGVYDLLLGGRRLDRRTPDRTAADQRHGGHASAVDQL